MKKTRRRKNKKPFKTNRHHKKAKINGGTNREENISIVPEHKHRCWHTIFGTMKAEEIAKTINDVWIDPDYQLIVIPRR